jgi:hypothetical protein
MAESNAVFEEDLLQCALDEDALPAYLDAASLLSGWTRDEVLQRVVSTATDGLLSLYQHAPPSKAGEPTFVDVNPGALTVKVVDAHWGGQIFLAPTEKTFPRLNELTKARQTI